MRGNKDAIGDSSKPRLSLIPKEALWTLGTALTHGEKRYGTTNWKEGIPTSYLIDAALRHILQFSAGEDIDEQSKNLHLGNALANLSMIIWLLEHKPECDDRYTKGKHVSQKNNKKKRTDRRTSSKARKQRIKK